MLYRTLACGVLLGSIALEVAATPVGLQHAAGAGYRRSIPSTHSIHERQLPHWAETWNRAEAVPGNAILPMRIGLKQQNLDAGHDMLMDISNPKSTNYGKHLSSSEIISLFAPERESVDVVVKWLTGAGIEVGRISQSANKQWLQFDAEVSEVEDLLMTKYYIFEHGASGTRDVAAEHYYLPEEVREHVDYITPGIRLRWDSRKAEANELRKKRSASSKERRGASTMITEPHPVDIADAIMEATTATGGVGSKDCTSYLVPKCIKDQYNIPNATLASEGNELGVFESLGQHYSKADLDSFYTIAYPDIPTGTYPIERLIDGAEGAVDSALAGSEAMLDFEAVMPLIYPQNSVLFQVDDERVQKNETSATTPYLGFLNNFFDAIDGSYCTFSAYGETGNCVDPECLDPAYPDPLPNGYNGTLQCGVFEPTNVISISYGGAEIDVPSYYWRRQCLEIMKLGLQGVSVVISSGDYGVASYSGDSHTLQGCLGADDRAGTVFNPSSQATCPYVLAVGSTSLNKVTNSTMNTTTLVEHAAQRFSGGGGFSNYFDRPSYQASAVEKYLSSVQLNFTGYYDAPNNVTELESIESGVFRITGRGYPDVSAIGERYMTRIKGQWYSIGGTSLSAPIWASILNLINEERIAAGKSTLGFVNPVLYEHPEVFNDITEGDNPGCNTDGFPAAEGWDPVTGLGSPNYPKLLDLLVDI